MPLVIAPDEPTAADVLALIEAHLAFAHGESPPEEVFALEAERLVVPEAALFSARRRGVLLGVGALRELDPAHGELTSMHTAARARGQGVGRAVLGHLLGVARARGYTRVSLETGTSAGFSPARALYASVGFRACPPFGDYRAGPHSVCMTLPLPWA